MVRKKGPDIPTATAGSSKSPSMVEKNSCPREDQDRSERKGVAGLRKQLKKARTRKRISELEDLGSHLGRRYVQHKKMGGRKRPSSSAGMSEGCRPNYMKPTTCSDARKERLPVSFPGSTTAGKKRSTGGGVHGRSNSSSSSAASSWSSPPSSWNKGAKALLVRPLMKKIPILGPPLFPKINASRATCSSTIKDTRFPKELELSHGATESEGTSAMRVCPYTHCSLNRHRHEPLPPLKTFVSSRRRLLKTQKSVRLKSLPSFRRRGSAKCDKRIKIPPLTDQLGDDFFVEIYAKLSEDTMELVFDRSDDTFPTSVDRDDDVGPANCGEELESVSGSTDSAEIKSSDCSSDESGSQGGNLGPTLEFAANEIKALADDQALVLLPDDVEDPVVVGDDDVLPGYLEGGLADEDVTTMEKQAQEAVEDGTSHFSGGVSECEDASYSDDKQGLEGVELTVSEEQAQEATVEDDDIAEDGHVGNDNTQNETPWSEGANHNQGDVNVHAAVAFRCDEILEPHSPEVGLAEMNEGSSAEDDVEVAERGLAEIIVPDCSLIEPNPNTAWGNDDHDAKPEELKNEASTSDEKAIEPLCDHGGFDDNAVTRNENGDAAWRNDDCDAEAEELKNDAAAASDEEDVEALCNQGGFDDDEVTKNENNVPAVTTCVPEMLARDQSLVEADANARAELKNEAPLSEDHLDDGCCLNGNKHESEVDQVSATRKSKGTSEWDDGLICGAQMENLIDPGEDEEFAFVGFDWVEEATADTDPRSICNTVPSETGAGPKSRYSYTRKVGDDHHEELKPFNPRAPSFLPVEPDPEAERVDLKHQMMEDRKNAEEWMIDYALQRVVSRLARARKRKVELLVEAFETVDDHGSPVLAHSRPPIQACS